MIAADLHAGDWDWAQAQYEGTDMPVQDIARAVGCSHTELVSRASRAGWTRNKGKLVAQMTAEMILANRERQAEKKLKEFEVIERVNAEMQARVLSTHRTDIKAARNICTRLFNDLQHEAEADLDTRSRILARLSDSMKTLLLLERQAYGISGVFEDVDKPPATTATPTQADAVLAKFAAVLAKNMGAVEVVDNDAGN